ncbi:MAG: SRPBCC family protein [Phycisphaerales bacterium]|nr:SRPBCC family protein [Phycisphaerales bacterium]
MKFQNSILIRAPQDVVWKVTEDIARWPEWTPTVDTIERLDQGTLDVGSAAYIKQPGLPRSKWVVTEMDRGRRFTWECTVLSIRMRATHALSAHDAGTENTLRLEMAGIAAVLLWPFLYFAAKRALRQENSGLKAHCEQLTNVQG